ncbi:MAG: hypothetical protein WCP89_04540 [archaeon]
MQSKQPDVSLYKITSENWKDTILDEMLSTQGLFLAKYIVVLDRVLEDKEIGPLVMDELKELKDSDHAWIIIEEKLTSINLKKIEKVALKIFDYNNVDEDASSKKQRILAFDFAEQFASKNKVGAWKELLKLKSADLAGEEIHGVLWWQMKAVYLAKLSQTVGDTGLAPYSYQKALRMSKGWERKELNNLLDSLVEIYHEAHRGNVDLMIKLEELALS